MARTRFESIVYNSALRQIYLLEPQGRLTLLDGTEGVPEEQARFEEWQARQKARESKTTHLKSFYSPPVGPDTYDQDDWKPPEG